MVNAMNSVFLATAEVPAVAFRFFVAMVWVWFCHNSGTLPMPELAVNHFSRVDIALILTFAD